MAATTTHSVTNADVQNELAVDTSQISSSSDRLSTGDIDSFIDRAAGQLNAIMRGRGVDPTSLEDDDQELVRSGVIAYATAKSYRALGHMSRADSHWEEWGSIRKTLRSRDRDYGDDRPEDTKPIDDSNVDTSSSKTDPTHGTGFGW